MRFGMENEVVEKRSEKWEEVEWLHVEVGDDVCQLQRRYITPGKNQWLQSKLTLKGLALI